MIDPQKSCIWTSRKVTELTYKNNKFIGTGISLRVLLHAFADTNFIWYSKIYGAFDDNIITIAIDKDTNLVLDELLEQNGETLPIKEAINKDFYFEEYALTDKTQSFLGIKIDEQVCRNEKTDCKIKYQINIHDNCFSSIEPVDKELLTKLLICVLRQHSFYLMVDVDWSNIISHIMNRLIEFSTIQIKSYPKRRQIEVKLGKDKRVFIKRILQPSLSDIIIINNGYAYTPKIS